MNTRAHTYPQHMAQVVLINHYSRGNTMSMARLNPNPDRGSFLDINWDNFGSDNKCIVGPVENMKPIIKVMEMVTGQRFLETSFVGGVTQWERADRIAKKTPTLRSFKNWIVATSGNFYSTEFCRLSEEHSQFFDKLNRLASNLTTRQQRDEASDIDAEAMLTSQLWDTLAKEFHNLPKQP